MTRSEPPKPLTGAALQKAVRDLQARVEALERRAAQPEVKKKELGVGLGLIDALTELTEPPSDPAVPAGTLVYAGVGQVGDDGLAWQMTHSLGDLLALDEDVLARQLAAIASPVRIRILRELVPGPLQTHELQARLDEPSAGQLYHHLRELLATGLVRQPKRSVYELPPRTVVPLLTLIACAHDLETATPAGSGEQ
jgi:DNA-binding HxlR family transcriptional regulator